MALLELSAIQLEPGGRGGKVVGEAAAGASLRPGRGRDPDGEQAFYGDALFAEKLF
jgi:hypothetical protein